jgi:hypothetical protein
VQAPVAYFAGMKGRQAAEAIQQGVSEQHDLDFLFGSWVEDLEVDRALADQRKIDADLWR